MRIAIIGQGAIAAHLRRHLPANVIEAAQITRPHQADHAHQPPRVASVADLPRTVDLVVDCAGHSALAHHGLQALHAGFNVLSASLGALADRDLSDALTAAGLRTGARLQLVSGAIGGLDALRAASTGRVSSVLYTGRKPPAGWRGSAAENIVGLDTLTEAVTHFSGSARDAALTYPKNANVAAAVALAGIGFDATRVTLIADPFAGGNSHEIRAKGDFGDLRFQITGHGLPDNPRSSALAAMSLVAAISDRQAAIAF